MAWKSGRQPIEARRRGGIVNALGAIGFESGKFCGQSRLHDRRFLEAKPGLRPVGHGQVNDGWITGCVAGEFHRRRSQRLRQCPLVQAHRPIGHRNNQPLGRLVDHAFVNALPHSCVRLPGGLPKDGGGSQQNERGRDEQWNSCLPG